MAGDQTGEAYSSMLLPIVLYVVTKISFSWPQSVPARAFITFTRFLAFSIVLVIWALKVCIVLKYTPRIFGSLSRSICSPFINILGVILNCELSLINSVTVDFSADSCSSLDSKYSTTSSV